MTEPGGRQVTASAAPGVGERLALWLYSAAWLLATPVVAAYLLWRGHRQPEYRRHWAERWAWRWQAPAPAPAGAHPLWIHAVSVGETRAAQSLIEALLARDPDLTILLTHMTPTGRAVGESLFAQRWPTRIRQAYLPYDQTWAMARFLAHWQPRAGLLMETELWPALCACARQRRMPLVLVNARLSARSLRKGRRWRALIAPALRSLAAVLAQTDADAERLRQFGRASVSVLGNLKFDITPEPAIVARAAAWRTALGGRGVVLAASTREGEEGLLLRAWQLHWRAWHSRGEGAPTSTDRVSTDASPSREPPVLLIVPRHPQRFEAVAAEIRAAGFELARRTGNWPGTAAAAAGPPGDPGVPSGDSAALPGAPKSLSGVSTVLLGDSMGEMAAYYALADVAIIGGSLLPFGAQNLIEACAQGVPVIVGPHTYNFEQAATEAVAAGAATRVLDADQAITQALALLDDAAQRKAMAAAGVAFSLAHRGATQRTLAELAPWLR